MEILKKSSCTLNIKFQPTEILTQWIPYITFLNLWFNLIYRSISMLKSQQSQCSISYIKPFQSYPGLSSFTSDLFRLYITSIQGQIVICHGKTKSLSECTLGMQSLDGDVATFFTPLMHSDHLTSVFAIKYSKSPLYYGKKANSGKSSYLNLGYLRFPCLLLKSTALKIHFHFSAISINQFS
jgi:hypothetical protein